MAGVTSTAPPAPATRAAAAEALRLRQACRDLEAVFLRHLVAGMQATLPEGGLGGSSAGSGLYNAMIEETLANSLADAGGVGLADLLYQQLYAPVAGKEPEKSAR